MEIYSVYGYATVQVTNYFLLKYLHGCGVNKTNIG